MLNKFDKYTDEAVQCLVNDNVSQAADCLEELAHIFAKADMSQENFSNWRQYIIDTARIEAKKRGMGDFFVMKLEQAERAANERRNGDRKTIII